MKRYAMRKDNTQDSIVAALRKAGHEVAIIGKPVDLAVRNRSWPPGVYLLAEAKTPNRADGSYTYDPRQTEQRAYVDANGIPIWLNAAQALEALVTPETSR